MPAVKLLSTPGIFLGEERVEVPRGKTSALLYYLAYQASWVNREDLLYLFWPDNEDQKARRNLRQLLSTIRQLSFTQNLETTEHNLRWLVPSDTQVFKNALEKKQWARAIENYQGPLLEGFRVDKLPEFESWLGLERVDLFNSYREAVFNLSEQLEDAGKYLQATDYLGNLYDFDPFDEHVLQRYLRLLALGAKHYKAMDVYERFATTLALELDTEPSADTQALIEKVRSGDVLEKRPPSKNLSSYDSLTQAQKKMPIPATHFVGRETEIAQLTRLLRDPACRLLNLVAVGGMGKTRLAIEVAERLRANFADSVYFVPFEAVSSPELMVAAIAETITFTFLGQQDPKEQLFGYLKSKQMLLIADNLEHLTEGVNLFSELLEHAPDITILATSRRILNLHAEWLYDVIGMSVVQTPDQTNDAVDLFVQSAKKATGEFHLSDQNRDAVVAICERVGGMPLAIELAASWLRVLTPQAIVAELGKGLEPLSGAARDMPERHHSIHGVFESSWNRLNPSEQVALKHLAVFRGGFNRETAERVARLSLPLLLSLSNKSFLRRDDTGRFTQHPLVWQFAREKAETDSDFDAVKGNHASYFATFLKAREEGHERLHAKTVRREIALELPNILDAWHWIVDEGREDLLEQALWSLCEYYRGENRFQEGEALFSRAEKQLPKNSLMRARLLHRLGIFNNMLGTYNRGAEILQESIRISKKQKAPWDEAHALFVWVVNRSFVNDISNEDTTKLYQKCAKIFRESGDLYHEARALGNISDKLKNSDEREQLMRYCIKLFRETQGYYGLTLMLNKLAYVLGEFRGNYQEATLLLEESLTIERQRDNPMRLVLFLDNYARVLSYQGSYSRAEQHFAEALALSRKYDVGRGIFQPNRALFGLGWLAFLRKDVAKAEAYLQESLALSELRNEPLEAVKALNTLSQVAFTKYQLPIATSFSKKAQDYLQTIKHRSQYWFYLKLQLLNNRANIALAQQRNRDALRFLHEALTIANEWNLIIAQLDLLLSYTDLLKQEGKHERTAILLSFISSHKVTVFATKEKAKERFASLPKRIREEALERSKMLELEQIIKDISVD